MCMNKHNTANALHYKIAGELKIDPTGAVHRKYKKVDPKVYLPIANNGFEFHHKILHNYCMFSTMFLCQINLLPLTTAKLRGF